MTEKHVAPHVELADFLLARIANDQEAAQAEWDWMIELHGPGAWNIGEREPSLLEWRYGTDRDRTLHVSPRRVLADCEAKRRIVELHSLVQSETRPDVTGCDVCGWSDFCWGPEMVDDGPCETLRLLALPYADHPDYREEWKP